MYPWKGALSWAESTQLQIDALGLITILGVDEVNISVGRLVSSRYVEFLPLLGAFVLAGNHFTKKQPNFVLYNLTEGVMTTELAGWFSRWLKAQEFHQIHHRIQWEARDLGGSTASPWTALAVSVPCNGIMVALTVLSADWWGFVNVFAMLASVAVRVVLVRENQAGIDRAIQERFKEEEPKNKGQLAKVIVVTDDSKVITMKIPRVLVGRIFTQTPQVPHPIAYECSRWIGWVAFGVQIISLGMASLLTQICTVVLIVLSTVLTVFKFGCDDRRLRTSIIDATGKQKHSSEFQENIKTRCSISPALTAICSEYPDHNDGWFQRDNENNSSESGDYTRSSANEENPPPGLHSDVEAQRENGSDQGSKRPRRRQDLFVWMGLSESELVLMENWNLLPSFQNEDWWKDFDEKCDRPPKPRRSWRDFADLHPTLDGSIF
jgi:hypothetical protein